MSNRFKWSFELNPYTSEELGLICLNYIRKQSSLTNPESLDYLCSLINLTSKERPDAFSDPIDIIDLAKILVEKSEFNKESMLIGFNEFLDSKNLAPLK